MITLNKYGDKCNRVFLELYGLSTDEKPIEKFDGTYIGNASTLYTMDDKKLSFEDAYKQLMELVKKMESGELPLADSVAAYEQGIKLKAYCEQLLKEAELKIETLKVGA